MSSQETLLSQRCLVSNVLRIPIITLQPVCLIRAVFTSWEPLVFNFDKHCQPLSKQQSCKIEVFGDVLRIQVQPKAVLPSFPQEVAVSTGR